ncbi:MAG TPA: Na/Pi symporter, partial [Planctomycetota bacterium]|nr:Na/Pi symporter [Planctomycetota bacterium]
MNPEALDWTKLLGGLGLLLFGIHNSEQTLTSVSLPSLRTFIHRYVPNRIAGVGMGFLITLFTQSSSATTVLLTGLMGMQLMTLTVALAVTLGSAVGSTFSVQLLALKFTQYGPLFLAAGFATRKLVSKYRTEWQLVGGMAIAMGLIFMGLQYMIESTVGMRSNPLFTIILEHLSSSYFYS